MKCRIRKLSDISGISEGNPEGENFSVLKQKLTELYNHDERL